MNAQLAALLIEALKSEIAGKPERVAKVRTIGAWATAKIVNQYFGVSTPRLKEWVAAGKVKGKKVDPFEPRSSVVYKVADVERTIEELPD